MTERWLPVVRHPDYMVSDLGRVYSHISQKFLKPGIASNGYPTVALGRNRTRTIHSLIADVFLGYCPIGQEIRHKDGNRKHCALTNLEYGTRSQNIKDAIKHGNRTRTTMNPTKSIATKDAKYPNWRKQVFKYGGFSCR